MALLQSLGQDDQNKVQHYFVGHVMQLVPVSASHHANGIGNSTIAFPMSS